MTNEQDGKKRTDDVFSKSLRAGNRTYFFDVKSTKSDDFYLTITESKRRFNNDNGKFFYEKHKLFLYPEDFQSFSDFLNETLKKVESLNGGKKIIPREELESEKEKINPNPKTESEKTTEKRDENSSISNFSDVNFEDLGSEDKD